MSMRVKTPYLMKKGLGLIIIISLLVGCSPKMVTQAPPKVIERHDTVTKYVAEIDTLIQYREVRDSSSFRQRGDTVTIERWHWERDYSYERELQQKIDSLVTVKADSIPYPVETPVYVELPLKWWQKALMMTGVSAILLIIFWLYWKIRR